MVLYAGFVCFKGNEIAVSFWLLAIGFRKEVSSPHRGFIFFPALLNCRIHIDST